MKRILVVEDEALHPANLWHRNLKNDRLGSIGKPPSRERALERSRKIPPRRSAAGYHAAGMMGFHCAKPIRHGDPYIGIIYGVRQRAGRAIRSAAFPSRDDYITFRCSVSELMVCVEALVRRVPQRRHCGR